MQSGPKWMIKEGFHVFKATWLLHNCGAAQVYRSGTALLTLKLLFIPAWKNTNAVAQGLKWQECMSFVLPHNLKSCEGKVEGWFEEWCSLMHTMFTGKKNKNKKDFYLTAKQHYQCITLLVSAVCLVCPKRLSGNSGLPSEFDPKVHMFTMPKSLGERF